MYKKYLSNENKQQIDVWCFPVVLRPKKGDQSDGSTKDITELKPVISCKEITTKHKNVAHSS